jgi:hypothetical protein
MHLSDYIYHFLRVAVIMLAVSACQSLKPGAKIFSHMPAHAPVPYKEGWQDGCQSGMAAGGNDLYRATYSHHIEVSKVQNKHYLQGWKDAEPYCRHYALSTLYEAGMLGQNPAEAVSSLSDNHPLQIMEQWGPSWSANMGVSLFSTIQGPWAAQDG